MTSTPRNGTTGGFAAGAVADGVLPVLMYHSIPAHAGPEPDDLRVPLAEFRTHLAELAADGWELLGLTEALAALAADPARRVVALTFDDGYADFLGAAAALTEFCARATLYVPTELVGTRDAARGAWGRRYLDWDELASLAASGVEIGSHSRRHRPLDTLPPDELDSEVLVSRVELEQRLGVAVSSFCYPYGYTSRRVRRAVVAAGYDNACVVGRRVARLTDDPFALPRVQAVPDLTSARLRRLVTDGEPGPAPTIKRTLRPAWRLARLASLRLLNRELT